MLSTIHIISSSVLTTRCTARCARSTGTTACRATAWAVTRAVSSNYFDSYSNHFSLCRLHEVLSRIFPNVVYTGIPVICPCHSCHNEFSFLKNSNKLLRAILTTLNNTYNVLHLHNIIFGIICQYIFLIFFALLEICI